MTVKTEHLLDKSTWLDGPWRDEPDRISWVDEGSHLPCLVLRNPEIGNLCGYVGVPPGHKAWGQAYVTRILVHGGLTYSGYSEGDHVVEGYADYWWLGFDCAHFGDKFGFLTPISMMTVLIQGEYRDVKFCMDQCERLASQLIKIDS